MITYKKPTNLQLMIAGPHDNGNLHVDEVRRVEDFGDFVHFYKALEWEEEPVLTVKADTLIWFRPNGTGKPGRTDG